MGGIVNKMTVITKKERKCMLRSFFVIFLMIFFVGNLKTLVYDTTLVRRFNSSATINVIVSANGIANRCRLHQEPAAADRPG